MGEPVRVTPQDAHNKVGSEDALLVCAYDDEEKCRKMQLKGSISLHQLELMAADLPKDHELIFY